MVLLITYELEIATNRINIPRKNLAEINKIIHFDYSQLMRAVTYVNEIIEQEIAAGILPERIIVSGYSQSGL